MNVAHPTKPYLAVRRLEHSRRKRMDLYYLQLIYKGFLGGRTQANPLNDNIRPVAPVFLKELFPMKGLNFHHEARTETHAVLVPTQLANKKGKSNYCCHNRGRAQPLTNHLHVGDVLVL